MNCTTFPKLDISKLLSCKILCEEHAQTNGYIESICSFPSCEWKKMLCSHCKEKNPEHAKHHLNFFKKPNDLQKTLENENDEFHKIVNDSLINATDQLYSNLEKSLENEKEKLNNFFNDFSQKFLVEIENLKIEIFSQTIKNYYSEIKNDFADFYSEKFQKFHENILTRFLNFHKISQTNEKMASHDFENAVNLIFNSRIVAIQLNNLKEEKLKSIFQNIPKLENLNIDDYIKKISNTFITAFKNLYYPTSPAISPVKTMQPPGRSFQVLRKGITFEEKISTYEQENEEFALKLNNSNEEELSNKVDL